MRNYCGPNTEEYRSLGNSCSIGWENNQTNVEQTRQLYDSEYEKFILGGWQMSEGGGKKNQPDPLFNIFEPLEKTVTVCLTDILEHSWKVTDTYKSK